MNAVQTLKALSDTPDTASTDKFMIVTADIADAAHTAYGGKYYISLRVAEGYGVRFSTEIYTRGCHWIPRMFA
jgi:hypothetical protein